MGLALGQLWGPSLLLLFVVILLFPDGRLPSALWRRALWVYCAIYAVLLVATAVATAGALAAHPIRVDASGGLSAVNTPAGWYKAVQAPVSIMLVVLSLCFIGRQVLSWRRSSSDRRQQLKWLASGGPSRLSVQGSRDPSARRAWLSLMWWAGLPGSAGRRCR